MLIYIDGDACPVKAETYRVAKRHGVKTLVVANDAMFVPTDPLIEMVVVKTGFDSADDWIVERIGPEDVAITSDIPLAERCLQRGARVLGRATRSARIRSAKPWPPAPSSTCSANPANSAVDPVPTPRKTARDTSRSWTIPSTPSVARSRSRAEHADSPTDPGDGDPPTLK